MRQHILTPEEILQLAHEYENLYRWEGVRQFAHLLFGTQAQKVIISVIAEYDDSHYNDEVKIMVLDSANNPLDYDLTLPWWSQFASVTNKSVEHEDDSSGTHMLLHSSYELNSEESINLALRNLFSEKVGIDLVESGQWHDPITFTFDVDTPPTISFPVVYGVA